MTLTRDRFVRDIYLEKDLKKKRKRRWSKKSRTKKFRVDIPYLLSRKEFSFEIEQNIFRTVHVYRANIVERETKTSKLSTHDLNNCSHKRSGFGDC